MTLLRPLYMQPGAGDPAIQYSAQDDRASLLSAVFSREGVLDIDAGQFLVTQRAAGANFSVDIAAGRASIVGDDVSDQGTYVVTNTATVNRTTPVAPGSGTRVHRVIARVKDKLHNGVWTGYDWDVEILQDTGAGTPATPASAISLATISIAAGQASVTTTPHITDTRPRASVGTPARTGTFPIYAGYNIVDATRPLTWHRNPDGWVSLSGFVRWSDVTTTYAAGIYEFTTASILLPPDIRPPSSRDFPGATSLGITNYLIGSDGRFYYRFIAGFTLTQNVSWFSFDGCGYRV